MRGEWTMRTAVVFAMTVACFGALERANAEGTATQSAEQASLSDAADCEAPEDISDRFRLSAAEHSHSGQPPSEAIWQRVLEQRIAEFEEGAWAWFQQSVDAPSVVPAIREAHPDFRATTLEFVMRARAIDAGTTDASPGTTTVDDLVLSVARQLMRQEFAEIMTFSGLHLLIDGATAPSGPKIPAVWTTFGTTLRLYEDIYDAFGYGTFDVLQAVYAASDNRLVMETHHLDSYDVLEMVGYQVAQRLMLDAMIGVASTCTTGRSCGQTESCETLAETAPRTCETGADFCRANQQADRLGICDAFPRRCEYAVECVHRTARGSGTDGDCIVDSWEALGSSELPSPFEGVPSNDDRAGTEKTR